MRESLLIFLTIGMLTLILVLLSIRLYHDTKKDKDKGSSNTLPPVQPPIPSIRNIDCVVSDWSLNCTRTPPYQRTRSVIVPPQGSGKACPPLIQKCCQRDDINSGIPFSENETPATQCTNVRNLNFNATAVCKDGDITIVNDPIWCK